LSYLPLLSAIVTVAYLARSDQGKLCRDVRGSPHTSLILLLLPLLLFSGASRFCKFVERAGEPAWIKIGSKMLPLPDFCKFGMHPLFSPVLKASPLVFEISLEE
jgi:hypothetical protein